MPLQYPGVFVKKMKFSDSLKHLTGYLNFEDTAAFRNWLGSDAVAPVVAAFVEQSAKSFGRTGVSHKQEKIVSIANVMKLFEDKGINAKLPHVPQIYMEEKPVEHQHTTVAGEPTDIKKVAPNLSTAIETSMEINKAAPVETESEPPTDAAMKVEKQPSTNAGISTRVESAAPIETMPAPSAAEGTSTQPIEETPAVKLRRIEIDYPALFAQIPTDGDAPVGHYIFAIQILLAACEGQFSDDDPEDIHRLVWVLKYAIKSSGGSRKSTRNRKERAIRPDYYKDALGTPPANSTQVEMRVELNAERLAKGPVGPILPEDECDSDGNLPKSANTQFINPVDEIEEALRQRGLSFKCPFPTLSTEARNGLLEHIMTSAVDISLDPKSNMQGSNNPLLQVAASLEDATAEIKSHECAAMFLENDFFALNKHLNTSGAIAPSYGEAAILLDVDLDKPVIGGIQLQPWQVTGAAWMLTQEAGRVGGGILADEPGLGKTIQMLTLIVKSIYFMEPPYRPTLIVVPSQLVDTWVDEILRYFPDILQLCIFYGIIGPGGITDPIRKRYTYSKRGLLSFFDKLDPKSPSTASTVIITSYTTWHKRFFGPSDGLDPGRDKEDEDEDTDENDEDYQEESSTKPAGTLISHWPKEFKFARIILDEGHAVKNVSTRVHRSIKAIPTTRRWVVTATPMINKAYDLRGLLTLFYRDNFENSAPDYTAKADMIDVYQESRVDNDEDLHLLNPTLYGKLFSNGVLGGESAIIALPRIFRKIQLRRVMGMDMDLGSTRGFITIGSQIPPYRVRTIDCPMTQFQMAQYARIHESLSAGLKRGGGGGDLTKEQEEVGGHFNMQTYRRLRHASLSVGLEFLFRATTVKREGNLASDIAKWRSTNGGGLLWLISRMMQDAYIPYIPPDREWIANYLKNQTPKYPTLTAILKHVIVDNNERIIVFVCYPTPQFETEIYIDLLQFKYLMLCAGMSNQERSEVAAKFNDPNSDVDILLVTYSTCSTGLNLHFNCNNVVMLEPAVNVNTALQAIGRVHRLGQKQSQNIWILSGSNTFDRFVEYNQAQKMMGQIIGMGPDMFADLDPGRDSPAVEVSAVQDATNVAGESEKVAGKKPATQITGENDSHLIGRADSILQCLLGQSSSRLLWSDAKDIGLSPAQRGQVTRVLNVLPNLAPISRSKATLDGMSPAKKRAAFKIEKASQEDTKKSKKKLSDKTTKKNSDAKPLSSISIDGKNAAKRSGTPGAQGKENEPPTEMKESAPADKVTPIEAGNKPPVQPGTSTRVEGAAPIEAGDEASTEAPLEIEKAASTEAPIIPFTETDSLTQVENATPIENERQVTTEVEMSGTKNDEPDADAENMSTRPGRNLRPRTKSVDSVKSSPRKRQRKH